MPRTYEVQQGDTLSEIAEREVGDAQAWQGFGGIPDDVMEDPRRLQPGTQIEIPTPDDVDVADEDGAIDATQLDEEEEVPETPDSVVGHNEEMPYRMSPEAELGRLQEERMDRIEEMRPQLDEAREERDELQSELESVYERTESMEDVVRQEQQRMGVETMMTEQRGLIQEISNLKNRSINLMEQRDAAVGVLGAEAVSTPFVTGQQARQAEAFDRRIETNNAMMGEKQAYLQSLQGQVDQARGLVSDIVDAKTYDTQLELQKVRDFLELNSEDINQLDNIYQREIKEVEEYWENQLEEEKQEKEQVLNMMIENPEAGVNSGDSLEDAAQKTATYLKEQAEGQVSEETREVLDLMMEYPGAGIRTGDNLIEAAEKAADYARSQPNLPDWELRTVGDDVYRIDPQSGAAQPLVRGPEQQMEGVMTEEDINAWGLPSEWAGLTSRNVMKRMHDPEEKPEGWEQAEWDQYRNDVLKTLDERLPPEEFNPGNYSNYQINKLDAAGISHLDIEAANEFLGDDSNPWESMIQEGGSITFDLGDN